MTKRWTFASAPEPEQLVDIAAVLREGGVVLLPTDTIYGLHALATDDGAVTRIRDLKGRADEKPFVAIGASLAQLEEIGIDVSPDVRTILDALWPAPLTAILPLRRPIAASRGKGSLAVRVPALEWLRELLAITSPLASTSANRSGEPPVQTPSGLASDLVEGLSGVADGGLLSGEPSVIVDFTGATPEVVREGESLFTQEVRKTLWKTL